MVGKEYLAAPKGGRGGCKSHKGGNVLNISIQNIGSL